MKVGNMLFILGLVSVNLISTAQTIVVKKESRIMPDSAITYSYSKTNDSLLFKIKTFTYDRWGNDSLQYAIWNDTLNHTWKLSDSSMTYYDDKNRDTMRIFKDNYSILTKYRKQYNHDGTIANSEEYGWNVTEKDWFGVKKVVYTTDPITSDSLQVEYKWDWAKRVWYPAFDYKRQLGEKSLAERSYCFDIDTATEKRSLKNKYVYYYDEKNRDTLIIYFYPISKSFINWSPIYKAEKKFDTMGHLIEYSEYGYSNTYFYWYLGSRTQWIYSGDTLKEERIIARNDSVGITTKIIDKIVYQYNKEGDKLFDIQYHFDSHDSLILIFKTKYYNSTHDVMTIQTDRQTSSIELKSSDNQYVYPNPAEEYINLRLNEESASTAEMVSSAGQIVYSSKHLQGLETIYIGNLPSGIYYLKINRNQTINVIKIVKL